MDLNLAMETKRRWRVVTSRSINDFIRCDLDQRKGAVVIHHKRSHVSELHINSPSSSLKRFIELKSLASAL